MFDNCLYCKAPLQGDERYLGECDDCSARYSPYYIKSSWKKARLNLAEGKPRFSHWKLFQMSVPRLTLYLAKLLTEKYKKVILDKDREYIYAKGDIPIMLVAHMDTVHKELPKVQQDIQQNILWSKTGLGADDRAGIAAIVELLDRGYRPHVLFTDKEESGGAGASAFIRDFHQLIDVNCIVELDRRGSDDSVYYECDTTGFKEYINSFGFKTAYGSFSDISIICPAIGIAGVNLSIGYYNAHSSSEYLKIEEWARTVDRVEDMLDNPPTEKFLYVPKYSWSYYSSSKYDSKYLYSYSYDDTDSISVSLGDIQVDVDVLDLVYSLGGTIVNWQKFLNENRSELEGKIRDAVLEEVANMCTSNVPNFLIE